MSLQCDSMMLLSHKLHNLCKHDFSFLIVKLKLQSLKYSTNDTRDTHLQALCGAH
jgi:hypothetical protein